MWYQAIPPGLVVVPDNTSRPRCGTSRPIVVPSYARRPSCGTRPPHIEQPALLTATMPHTPLAPHNKPLQQLSPTTSVDILSPDHLIPYFYFFSWCVSWGAASCPFVILSISSFSFQSSCFYLHFILLLLHLILLLLLLTPHTTPTHRTPTPTTYSPPPTHLPPNILHNSRK